MPVGKSYVDNLRQAGTYLGNGTSHDITCGFRPKVVIITTEDGKKVIRKHDNGPSVGYGQVASGNQYQMRAFKIDTGTGITISDTGFTIDDNPNLNADGITYLWEVR